jgi:hypothetical protein
MARFNPATGRVENSDAADQALAMVTFAEKQAAENEARLAALKDQQKLIKEPKPILNEKGYPTGQKTLGKGVVAGKPLMTDPKTGMIVTAPKGTVDPNAMPVYNKGGDGKAKDNRTVITPMQELQQTLDRLAGKYDTLTGEAEDVQAADTAELKKKIAASGGDVSKALSEFLASQIPSDAYGNVKLAGPALAGENPLLAALRGQGAGTAQIDEASARQNEMANLLSSFAQQNVAGGAEAAKANMDALNTLGSDYAAYVRDVALPELQKTEQAKIDKTLADELANLATNKALAEEAARQARVDATQKVVVPVQPKKPKAPKVPTGTKGNKFTNS